MNAESGPIDLARAPSFTLGTLEVRPATREVCNGGASEILQPRIMQVLVALAARRGAVVSRDDLTATCWSGQIVGDDAINRCIAKLRQIGDVHGAFEIVTIARVGYRLDCATPNAASPARAPVLAVLPFENLSSDPEMQFFSDGVSEEILFAVSRLTGLRVIASSSSFSFRGARKGEAARALGATHVLDGSVRRGGARVRIAAQFSEAENGQVLWNEHYDREITDVLALQDEIAGLAAAALLAHLAPSAPPQPQLDPQAYDLYLRARTIRRTLDPWAQEKAISYLQAALAIAPDFARARAALAYALCQRIAAATVINAPPEAFDAAVAAARAEAERALALDASDVEAQAALLSLQPYIGAWAMQERAVNAALATSPSDSFLLAARGRLLFGMGRTREGYADYRQVFASDPVSPHAMAYEAVRRAGFIDDLSGARALIDQAFATASKDPIVWRLRTAVLTYQGDWDEAIAMLDSGLEVGQTAERLGFFRQSYEHSRSGGPAEQNPTLQYMPLLIRRSPFLLSALLFGATVSHRNFDLAFDLVDTAMALYPPEKLWSQWNAEGLNVAPQTTLFIRRNAPLRMHPRFLPLCARLGLCAYWAESGAWPDFIVDAPSRGELERQARQLAASASA